MKIAILISALCKYYYYFPKSLIGSSKNVDDTVLKESVRLKDVRFVLFSMLIILNKEHYFESSATSRALKPLTLQLSVI